MGVRTFRPRGPCSPAGPSGPRGPWNREKGLAQWTAGVSLGLGTRRVGLAGALGFSLPSLRLPPPLSISPLTPTLRQATPVQCVCWDGSAEGSHGCTLLEALPLQNGVSGAFKPCLKRPWVVSQPAHFTDTETEVQRQETHGQVLTARSSDSAVACFPQGTLGHKQVYEPQPLGTPTEKDLGRVCLWPQLPLQPAVQTHLA